MTGRISIAVRVAGIVVAGGYLLGLTEGPLMMVVGGFALMTFGRGLVVERSHEALAGAALAVMAAALGVVALRWGTFDLSEIRGVQGVLGPTLAVGPEQLATAAGAAAAGGMAALIVWLGEAPDPAVDHRWLWLFEAACGALALVTVFWGPAWRGFDLVDIAVWAAALAFTAAFGVAGSFLVRRVHRGLAWSACAAGALASVTAAALVAIS